MPRRIQEAGTAQGLVRQFRIQGGLPLSLDEIVVPVVVVGDIQAPPSAEDPRQSAWGYTRHEGVVAQIVRGALNNPLTSGRLLVLRRVVVYVEPSTFFLVHASPMVGLLDDTGESAARSGTIGDGTSAAGFPSSNSHIVQPATGQLFYLEEISTDAGRVELQPNVVIQPGFRYELAVTEGMPGFLTVNFWWDELAV